MANKETELSSVAILKKDQVRDEPGDNGPQTLREILAESFKTFVNGFIIAYGLRTGLSLAMRVIYLMKKNPTRLLSFSQLLSEKNLIVRVAAVRLGLTLGGFTGGYTLIKGLLDYNFGRESKWNSLIGGTVAGLCLLFQERENRRTPALYLLARLAQCLYNSSKSRGKWHLWGSSWSHGDTLLFALSSAQVMYAYVMRPDTIPVSYFNFIARTSPIAIQVLSAVRAAGRGEDIGNMDEIIAYCLKHGNPTNIEIHPPLLPCSVMHPMCSSCIVNASRVWFLTAKKIYPLYASLTFVPIIVLHFSKFMKSPLPHIWKGIQSTLQSMSFLCSFCMLYQAVICAHRNVASKDNKLIYWLAGLICSSSLLLERKSRRSELALYVLPRALDSFFQILADRKLMASVPHIDTILFCISMADLCTFINTNLSQCHQP